VHVCNPGLPFVCFRISDGAKSALGGGKVLREKIFFSKDRNTKTAAVRAVPLLHALSKKENKGNIVLSR
jgi:hypothetical protein